MPIGEIPIDATEPTILIPEVRKLNLGPDDILVLRFQEELSPQAVAHIRHALTEHFGVGRRVMILQNGAEIDVVSKGM